MYDYQLRGKCKELAQEYVSNNPDCQLIRGYYHCPLWGEQQHWWVKKPDGSIYDPTKNQFPSCGFGTYIEFDGFVKCEECGKVIHEDEMQLVGRYPVCSGRCACKLVGIS